MTRTSGKGGMGGAYMHGDPEHHCPHLEIEPVGPGRSEFLAGDCIACKQPLLKTETETVDGKLVFKPFVYVKPIGKSRKRWTQAAIDAQLLKEGKTPMPRKK